MFRVISGCRDGTSNLDRSIVIPLRQPSEFSTWTGTLVFTSDADDEKLKGCPFEIYYRICHGGQILMIMHNKNRSPAMTFQVPQNEISRHLRAGHQRIWKYFCAKFFIFSNKYSCGKLKIFQTEDCWWKLKSLKLWSINYCVGNFYSIIFNRKYSRLKVDKKY